MPIANALRYGRFAWEDSAAGGLLIVLLAVVVAAALLDAFRAGGQPLSRAATDPGGVR
nr:hypothetical protein [Micromonospora sp. DSM 115978]